MWTKIHKRQMSQGRVQAEQAPRGLLLPEEAMWQVVKRVSCKSQASRETCSALGDVVMVKVLACAR